METKTMYTTSPVIAVCSCLRLTIPDHPVLSKSPLGSSWVTQHDFAKSANLAEVGNIPLKSSWMCGRASHYGLGTLNARTAYYAMEPNNPYGAPANRLGELVYCALMGWSDFYREDFWFATPYNSFPVDQDGKPVGIIVPFLTGTNMEAWHKENSIPQIDEESTHQAKVLASEFSRLVPHLTEMFAGEQADHKYSAEILANKLNVLSASAVKARKIREGASTTSTSEASGISLNMAELAKTIEKFEQVATPPGQVFPSGMGLALSDDALKDYKEALEDLCKTTLPVPTVTVPEPPLHPYSVPSVPITLKGEKGEAVWVDEIAGTTYSGKLPNAPDVDHVNTKCVMMDLEKVATWKFDDDHTPPPSLDSVAYHLGLSPEAAGKILLAHQEETLGGFVGKDSGIGWTTHTFNPWWGCSKCAIGCVNCYAETLAKRWRWDIWGKHADRRRMSPTYWEAPKKWHVEAERLAIDGKRDTTYVFAGSMCDVFEKHEEMEWREVLSKAKAGLYILIDETPALTWLILTKRPGNILDMIPSRWQDGKTPGNVWYGGSVSIQDDMDAICAPLEEVRSITGAPYFLSVEPMIGPVRLGVYNPDWVIIGGESGPKARPFAADWALNLMHFDCKVRGIPVFLKQIGSAVAQSAHLDDYKGANPDEWRTDLRVRHFPGDKLIWPARLENQGMEHEHEAHEVFDQWDMIEI